MYKRQDLYRIEIRYAVIRVAQDTGLALGIHNCPNPRVEAGKCVFASTTNTLDNGVIRARGSYQSKKSYSNPYSSTSKTTAQGAKLRESLIKTVEQSATPFPYSVPTSVFYKNKPNHFGSTYLEDSANYLRLTAIFGVHVEINREDTFSYNVLKNIMNDESVSSISATNIKGIRDLI